jgi:hypothetical protein
LLGVTTDHWHDEHVRQNVKGDSTDHPSDNPWQWDATNARE